MNGGDKIENQGNHIPTATHILETQQKPVIVSNAKPIEKTQRFDLEKLNKVYEKKYKQKENFVSTTSFFIDQFITNEQIISIHHAMLNVDVLHTLNNCSTELGNSCKQTLETLKIIHILFGIEITDEDVLKPLIDSYFVGVYHTKKDDNIEFKILPIFLNIHGDFKDFRQQFDYWVDYRQNIKNKENIEKPSTVYDVNSYKISKYIANLKETLIHTKNQDKIDKINDTLSNYESIKNNRTYYSFQYKNSFYDNGGFKMSEDYVYTRKSMLPYNNKLKEVYGKQFKLSQKQLDKIKSQLFDINILTQTLDIQSTTLNIENSILVGMSEYTRNHPSRYIYMNFEGTFLDSHGNYFWPLYETSIVKITSNNKTKPYGIYLFQKVKSNDTDKEKLKEDLVGYNYYFHFPEQKSLDETNTALAKTMKTILLSVTIGLVIDASLLYETYLQQLAKETAHHSWLMANHTEFKTDIHSLKDTTGMKQSQIDSMKDFVKHYKDTVHKQIDLKVELGQKPLNTKDMYNHMQKHHYDSCSNSIQKLLTLYPSYDFPKPHEMTGATHCQESFLKSWQKKYNADFSKNYGDGSGIGDTDGSAYWFHSAGHGSVTESSKVFQHEMEKISNKHANSMVVKDKLTIDKYLNNINNYSNTTAETNILNTISSTTHFSTNVAISTGLTLQNKSQKEATQKEIQDLQKITQHATESISKYNDTNSEYRKNSDKEVSAFIIKSHINDIEIDIKDSEFMIDVINSNNDENIDQNFKNEQLKLFEKNKNESNKKLETLKELQLIANKKEEVHSI